jgi:hypothetical protein
LVHSISNQDIGKGEVHFVSPDVNSFAVQGLLHSNKYLHRVHLVGELTTYLYRYHEKTSFHKSKYDPRGRGHLLYLKSSVCANIMVDTQFLQVDEIRIDQSLIIDVLNLTKDGWS